MLYCTVLYYTIQFQHTGGLTRGLNAPIRGGLARWYYAPAIPDWQKPGIWQSGGKFPARFLEASLRLAGRRKKLNLPKPKADSKPYPIRYSIMAKVLCCTLVRMHWQ